MFTNRTGHRWSIRGVAGLLALTLLAALSGLFSLNLGASPAHAYDPDEDWYGISDNATFMGYMYQGSETYICLGNGQAAPPSLEPSKLITAPVEAYALWLGRNITVANGSDYGTNSGTEFAAAIAYILKTTSTLDTNHMAGHATPSLSSAVQDKVAQIKADAKKYAGPYTSDVTITLPAGSTSGTALAALTSASGNQLAGASGKATITGPATFSNGSTSLDLTSKSSPSSLGFTVTGSGTIKITVTWEDVPSEKVRYTEKASGSYQPAARRDVSGGASVKGSDSVTATLDFQPVVTSSVPNQWVAKGALPADTIIVKAQTGDTWATDPKTGNPVDVVVKGTLYGPYNGKQATAAKAPAGAPVYETMTVHTAGQMAGANSTKAITINPPKTVTQAGYYTWVWEIVKADQPDPTLITGDYSDGFFTAGEVVTVPFQPELTSAVPSQWIGKGDKPADTITITAASGDKWLEDGNGNPIDVIAEGTLYGPYAGPQAASKTVPAGAPVYTTATVHSAGNMASANATKAIAINPAKAVTTSGYYTWVWKIVRASQPDPAAIDGDFSDGFFTTGETISAPFQPEVTSQVPAMFVNKGKAPIDTITVKATAGDLWLQDASGTPVDVLVEGTLYGPYDKAQATSATAPAGAPVAATATVHTAGQMASANATKAITVTPGTTLSKDGYYSWVWKIVKAHQPDPKLIEGDFADKFFQSGETVIAPMTPQIATQRSERLVRAGDPMVDSVTVTMPAGDKWLYNLAGKAVSLTAKGTLYGPYDVPVPPSATVPAGAPVAGTETLTFTATGTQKTTGKVTAPKEGFYTWVWQFVKNDQAADMKDFLEKDVTDSFMVVNETTSARYQIEHYSEAREYNVHPGGRAFDELDIKNMPATHTQFDGITGWIADVKTATVTAYGPFDAPPAGKSVPAGAPVLATETINAVNGHFRIGYGDTVFQPTEPGYYVFVYSFAGDDRVEPFTSDFDDIYEMFFVPGNGKPTVVTQATTATTTGGTMEDTALVVGDVPAGAYLTFTAYGPVPAGEQATCTEANALFTSEKIAVDGAGIYKSGKTTATTEGTVYWIETLHKKDGSVIDQGKCGTPGESTSISKVTTKATPSIRNGGKAEDTAIVTGDVPDGAYLTFQAFGPQDASQAPVCTSQDATYTSEQIDVTKAGEYKSGQTGPITKPGNLYWIETLHAKDGTIISKGKCGLPEETTTVTNVTTKATEAISVGGTAEDTAIVEGQVPDGSYLTFDAYGPQDAAAKPVCSDPVFTSAKVEVAKAGQYKSGPTKPITKPGNLYWIETLHSKDGSVLSKGTCGLPDETTKVISVTTKADQAAITGEQFGDTAIVTGPVPDGAYLTFDAYGPQDASQAPVCAKPFFTSAKVEVAKAGEYQSATTSVDKTGNVYWIETLHSKDGSVLAQGKCGLPNETTAVTKDVKVTTKATTRVVVGGKFQDTGKVSGTVPAGSYLVFRAYGPQDKDATPVCTAQNLLFTSKNVAVDKPGTYQSDSATSDTAGVAYWVETLYGKDGQQLATGKCGVMEEMTTIINGGGNGAGAKTVMVGSLAMTGSNIAMLAICALALIASGVFSALAIRRRATRQAGE